MGGEIAVRGMRPADLDLVSEICDSAFRSFIGKLVGRDLPPPMFAPALAGHRFGADPTGCHVAIQDGRVIGANFSIARGTLGFFGPLAVAPEAQSHGAAQRLVQACMDSWQARGVQLMGLETFGNSPFHLHLYRKLGFEPACTGLTLLRELQPVAWPAGVEEVEQVPTVEYLYPGFDAAADVAATRRLAGGAVVGRGAGFAICHTTAALWPDRDRAHLPLLVAPDRETFDSLVDACEHLATQAGRTRMQVQVPGSARVTLAALLERGYRLGAAAIRMKQGPRGDYDAAPIYYLDDWH